MIIQQRSPEWFEIRRGKITSSEIYKIMSAKDALTETARTYLFEKAAEILGNGAARTSQLPKSAALEWGTELEPLAIETYSTKYKVEVTKASFIPYTQYYGGSPDGLVLPDGIIETKCPYNTANHLKYSLIESPESFKKIVPEYYYQCVSNIICAKAQWCDFVSFDPRLDDKYNLFVYRLQRDETEVESVLKKVEAAELYIQDILHNLEKRILLEG